MLVTGTRFVTGEHIAALRAAGYRVRRLKEVGDRDALARAVRGIRGYIWGGLEILDEEILQAADRLEAIAFPGSGYTEFITAHEHATRRGIAISTAHGTNAPSVAQYTIALLIAMVRSLPVTLATTTTPVIQLERLRAHPPRELEQLALGIVGFGQTGRLVAGYASSLGMTVLVAKRAASNKTEEAGCEVTPLPDLLRRAEVVSLHVDAVHGHHVLKRAQLRLMKRDAILINVAFPDAVDPDALAEELRRGRLRAAFDAPPAIDASRFAPGALVASAAQAAFDTVDANNRAGAQVTQAMIGMLEGASVPSIVNPEYADHRGDRRPRGRSPTTTTIAGR